MYTIAHTARYYFRCTVARLCLRLRLGWFGSRPFTIAIRGTRLWKCRVERRGMENSGITAISGEKWGVIEKYEYFIVEWLSSEIIGR